MGCVVASGVLDDCGGPSNMTFMPVVSLPFLVMFAVVAVGLVAWGYLRRPRAANLAATLRRLAMVAALTVALAGPALPVEQEDVVSNVEIVIAVDRTGSMAAEDGPEGAPRLDAVRRDIRALVEGAGSARFSVVTWDSSSRVELPSTTDSSAVVNFANNLHQEVSEFSTGSTLARPAQTVLEVLQNSVEVRPQDGRFLVVFTDGESTAGEGAADEDATQQTLTEISHLIDGGAVLGYGTQSGGPMRVYGVGGVGVTEEYMVDENGEVALSVADEDALANLAQTLGVSLEANPTEEDVRDLGEGFVAGAGTVLEGRPKVYTYFHFTWVPALVLGGLLTWEVSAFVKRARRLRATNAI